MQIPILPHRGQCKPWGSIPRINWSHPLARGLVSYGYDAGSGPIDLVTGGQRTISNTAIISGAESTKYGSALRSTGSASTTLGGYNLPGNAAIEGLCVAAPYSFACGLMMKSNPNAFNVLFSTCNATSVSPVQVGLNGSTTDFWWAFGFGTTNTSASGVHKQNSFQTLLGVALTSSTAACYIDGARALSPSVTTTRAADTGVRPSFFGWRSLAAQDILNGFVYYGALWKGRALTDAEARLLHDDPYCFLIYPEDEIDALWTGSSASTGDLAATEAIDVAAFAGSVGVSGTLASTDATDIAAFAGSVVVSGTLASTEPASVAVFAGSVGVSGTLAATGPADAAAFAGSVGSIASGTLATTEATDVAAFAGGVLVSGTLAATGPADVAVFAGSAFFSGTLAATEAPDVAAFAGSVSGLVGSLVANEIGVGITNVSFPANSPIDTVVGSLFVAGIDTAVFNGVVGVSGALAVTEANDIASFAGTLPNVIFGTLVANEAGVSLTNYFFPANSAVNTVIGTLSVAGVDIAAFNGAVGVNGTLGATETADTALFNGQVIPIGIAGALVATEAGDIAAFTGAVVGVSGTLAAIEAKDIAAFNATVVITGQLSAIDVSDTAAFEGYSPSPPQLFGILTATETKDIAYFTGHIGDEEFPADFASWKFGKRFDRSLTSRFPWQ